MTPSEQRHQSELKLTVTAQEWEFVNNLIRDVQEQERHEQFAAALYQWDLAIRQFRRIEKKALIDRDPSSEDFLHHSACLHLLIGVGKYLEIEAGKHSDDSLKVFHIRKEDLRAYTKELEHTLNEVHGEIDSERIKEIQAAIFGECGSTANH